MVVSFVMFIAVVRRPFLWDGLLSPNFSSSMLFPLVLHTLFSSSSASCFLLSRSQKPSPGAVCLARAAGFYWHSEAVPAEALVMLLGSSSSLFFFPFLPPFQLWLKSWLELNLRVSTDCSEAVKTKTGNNDTLQYSTVQKIGLIHVIVIHSYVFSTAQHQQWASVDIKPGRGGLLITELSPQVGWSSHCGKWACWWPVVLFQWHDCCNQYLSSSLRPAFSASLHEGHFTECLGRPLGAERSDMAPYLAGLALVKYV